MSWGGGWIFSLLMMALVWVEMSNELTNCQILVQCCFKGFATVTHGCQFGNILYNMCKIYHSFSVSKLCDVFPP